MVALPRCNIWARNWRDSSVSRSTDSSAAPNPILSLTGQSWALSADFLSPFIILASHHGSSYFNSFKCQAPDCELPFEHFEPILLGELKSVRCSITIKLFGGAAGEYMPHKQEVVSSYPAGHWTFFHYSPCLSDFYHNRSWYSGFSQVS